MATALMKSAASASSAASARRKTAAPAGARAIGVRSMLPVRPSRQGAVAAQAFYLSPYSCRPAARVYRSSPFSLGMGRLASELLRESAACTHAMEIATLEDRYVLTSDCPGMGEEDISVEISPERVITIAGARKAPALQQHRKPEHPEAAEPAAVAPAADGEAGASAADSAAAAEPAVRVSYRFSRSFALPEDAEAEGVSASLDKGVLTVTVPRRAVEKPKPRRVSVSAIAPAPPTEQ
ncbi:hypothetical protein HYH02_007484 [Chlamydomonas schloesseri]|uniref:SHSP domain-containing protein n=1 Tax=Chlamydomonas schloesseri TaxID=2026947 RepID=A0A836B4Q7_9CHLO|nr:hypothetical protein HYH02_007484 [Chlamydomonas schloesseri]|eukprot:KAG2447560.1 hypothetical protein HYH02_007484 [Chlamydomonas schloesseri]